MGDASLRVEGNQPFTLPPPLFIMDSQPSTSSGAMDQRRKDALKAYREVGTILYHTGYSLTIITENAST